MEPEATEAIDAAFEFMPSQGQEALVQAIEILSEALGVDPLGVGESRTSQLSRIAFEPPLTVFFRIEKRLRTVRIFAAFVGQPRSS